MGILGIKNRTENWKTAKTFARFFDDEDLKRELVIELEPSDTDPEYVKLELFWKGIHDHLSKRRTSKRDAMLPNSKIEDLHRRYIELKLGLRNKIECFVPTDVRRLNLPASLNYCERPLPHEHDGIDCRKKLAENLMNTEVDIVLETPNNLFIGEAKDESTFDANGGLVLVHQLIRQYVMARILVDLLGTKQNVVPFIVWSGAKRHIPAQVQFMLKRQWLKEKNILTWNGVKGKTAGTV